MRENSTHNPPKIKGITVHPFESPDDLIDFADRRRGILVAVNAEKVVNADPALTQIINSNIGYCDGAGAVKALHRKGHPSARRIPGCELWLHIISRFSKSRTFYLVGAKPGVVDTVVSKLRDQFPGINIVGFRHGYIKTPDDHRRLLDDIARTRPDIVFVAMGSPRQEKLMLEMQQVNPGAIYQGLGGSFDVYAGLQPRAPRWWRDHNLEFAYRFIATPKRITRIKPYLRFAMWLYTGRI